MQVTGVEVKTPRNETKNKIAASTTTAASPNVKLSGNVSRVISNSLLKPKLLSIPYRIFDTKPKTKQKLDTIL